VLYKTHKIKNNLPGVSWKLMAAIEHHGDNPKCGHYNAWLRAPVDWWHVNDADTRTPPQPLKENLDKLYLLFFERV
jgi:uncharacterized UBP type Zn finger protein